jgi:nitroreductase
MDATDAIEAPSADAQALARLLNRRHSCRAFLPQPVERAVIERMLAQAQRTASWCNAQPWQVELLSGDAARRFAEALLAHVTSPDVSAGGAAERLDFGGPSAYTGVYQSRRRTCGFGLYESLGIARGDRAGAQRQALENFKLFGAPHVALVTTPAELGAYGAIDCGAWAANFMLAATAEGLGCIAQAALAAHPDFVRAHLGLPADRRIVLGISFGHAEAEHPANRFRTERADWRDAVRWHED